MNAVRDEVISALSQLGIWMHSREDDDLATAIRRANFENPWFTIPDISHALDNIVSEFLQEGLLRTFAERYPWPAIAGRRVGLVMAGNLPLVGIHDLICVLLSGHMALLKLSDKDKVMMSLVVEKLKENELIHDRIKIVEKLSEFDAVIATGSNAAAQHFRRYFKDYPHIIRSNRNGIAVLTGSETLEEIHALGTDVFQYFGLGCRSVSKLMVPKNYDFEILLEEFKAFNQVILHPKYKNNYEYNFATLVINRQNYMTNGSIIIREDDAVASRIASLHYATYRDQEDLLQQLHANRDQIQCVMGHVDLPDWDVSAFGTSQKPRLDQFADGIDTMSFLTNLEVMS